MQKRKEKRTKIYRGMRRHGKGNIKNNRGSGNRGGKGNAGLKKHKFTWVIKYAPDYFKSKGFVRPNKKKIKTINLYEIENLHKKGEIKKEFVFEGKILGTGLLTKPIKIKAVSWTKKAEEKIKNIGGEISNIGEKK